MQGRTYTVPFNQVSVSAAQDLFEILGAADKVTELAGLNLSQSSDAGDSESEQLHISVRRVTGSPTSGSGGSTVTPVALDPSDAAFGGTCEANNTTQLSGGTNTVVMAESFNVMAGLPLVIPEEMRPRISGATRLLVELESAPNDAVTMDGYATIIEYG